MKPLTKKIGLVLISSSLILNGCAHHSPVVENEKKDDEPDGWYFHSPGGFYRTGGYYSGGGFSPVYVPVGTSGGGYRSGGGFSSGSSHIGGSGGFHTSISSRGGFGSAGHAFGGSGA
jgi:hypothetical protein